MMNISCNKPVTACAGETLTITCFTCGIPSSKEWAQKIRSRPASPHKPYFPFLMQLQPPQGSSLREDGSTYVCAFCHASLEAQWKNYERQSCDIPPVNRKYNLYKFICAVCGVQTYRKRVRTLPFQEFPFLANQRPAGSLTLGNNPLAVVCLDCSETLWAQSAEYDRWGLPIHKRRFNWLARPPPDPDSLEATVARLPSGETQLPRCPPTEPQIKPKDTAAYESGGKHKTRVNKGESNSGSESNLSGRKFSLTTQSNTLLEAVGAHSQPPVVTVAPMSTHSATLSAHQKETMTTPGNPASSQYPKYESISTSCVQPSQLAHPFFPRSQIFQTSSYGPFPWGTREGSISEHYPYASMEALQSSSSSTWAWLPPQTSNLIQYQNYLPSSFSNRSYSVNDSYYNPSHSGYPPSPESNTTSAVTNASTHYLPPFSLRNSTRSTSPPQQTTHSPKSAISHMGSTNPKHSVSIPATYDLEASPPLRRGSTADLKSVSHLNQETVYRKTNLKHPSNLKSIPETATRAGVPKKPVMASSVHREGAFKSTASIAEGDVLPINFKPKSNAIRNHMNERSMNSNKQKVSQDRGCARDPLVASRQNISEELVPKKWQRQSHNQSNREKVNRSRNLSESEPINCSVAGEEAPSGSPPYYAQQSGGAREGENISASDTVIDLSLPAAHKNSSVVNSNPCVSSKNTFMIAYLCQSDPGEPPSPGARLNSQLSSSNESISAALGPSATTPIPASGRQTVIITSAKPDSTNSDVTSFENSSPSNDGSDVEVSSTHSHIETIAESPEDSEKLQTQDSACFSCPDESPEPLMCSEIKSKVLSDELAQGEFVQDYVKRVICERKTEERQAKQLKRKLEEDQEGFLETLGLMTPQKRSELELNILIKRSDHHTLPPLKRRPSTPPRLELGEEFENQLLEIAFDEPSLKKCNLSEDEVAFLAQLDLKPASKFEKNNRELQWRFVLTERMMRKKRGASFCGAKKLWSSDLASAKFLLPPKTPSSTSLFESLSLILPTLPKKPRSSDSSAPSNLLRIAEDHSVSTQSEKPHRPETITVSATCVMQPVISYPKYIPSYSSQASVPDNVCTTENSEFADATTSSLSSCAGQFSSRSESPGASSKSLIESNSTEAHTNLHEKSNHDSLSNQNMDEDSRILKVPVFTASMPPSNPVKPVGKEQDGSSEKLSSPSVSEDGSSSMCSTRSIVDRIIDADALNCENFVNQINSLLNPVSTASAQVQDETPAVWPQSISEWKKLKNYLQARQSQIKDIEDMLKKEEKKILSQLSAFSNNSPGN